MYIRKRAGVLKQLFGRIPYSFNWKDAALYAGAGGLGAGLLSAVLNRKKKRNLLYSSLLGGVGAVAGMGLYTLKQNALELTNGMPANKVSDWLEKIEKPQGEEGKTYMFYFAGGNMNSGKGYNSSTATHGGKWLPEQTNKQIATVGWADWDRVAKWVDANIRPQDKVIFVGHSLGGGGAIKASKRVKNHKIDKLITLDPVTLDPVLRYSFSGLDNVGRHYNFRAKNITIPNESNKWVANNPGYFDGPLPGAENITIDDDHGMHASGFRTGKLTPLDAYNNAIALD